MLLPLLLFHWLGASPQSSLAHWLCAVVCTCDWTSQHSRVHMAASRVRDVQLTCPLNSFLYLHSKCIIFVQLRTCSALIRKPPTQRRIGPAGKAFGSKQHSTVKRLVHSGSRTRAAGRRTRCLGSDRLGLLSRHSLYFNFAVSYTFWKQRKWHLGSIGHRGLGTTASDLVRDACGCRLQI